MSISGHAVDLAEKLAMFADHWSPKVIARINDYDGEVHAMLIEPTGVVNTGNAGGPLTAGHDDSLV